MARDQRCGLSLEVALAYVQRQVSVSKRKVVSGLWLTVLLSCVHRDQLVGEAGIHLGVLGLNVKAKLTSVVVPAQVKPLLGLQQRNVLMVDFD